MGAGRSGCPGISSAGSDQETHRVRCSFRRQTRWIVVNDSLRIANYVVRLGS